MSIVQKLRPASKIMKSIPEIDFSIEKLDTENIKSFCNLVNISSGYVKTLCQPFALAHFKSVITPLNTSKIMDKDGLNPILYITYNIDDTYSDDGIYVIRELDGLNAIINIDTKTAIWVHSKFELHKKRMFGFDSLYRYEIYADSSTPNITHHLRGCIPRGCVGQQFKSVSWAMYNGRE